MTVAREHLIQGSDRAIGLTAEKTPELAAVTSLVAAIAYLEAMPRQADVRSHGRVFDDIAEQYDRHRPAYPDVLLDMACETAGIGPDSEVLEIGCGTGQLTRSLLARGLRVTAVEPGRRLIARARERLSGAGEVRFLNSRLEDAQLPLAGYSAVFSASAIHWVDPAVSWRKAADALVDGGTFALVSYFGLDDPRSAGDQKALREALRKVEAGPAAEWPTYRDLDSILAGVAARRGNISEVWAWLGGYELARDYAADLFDDVQVATVPMQLEHTAEELNALLGTMSFWARLSPPQRNALAAENQALHERIGRPMRSSTLACLVLARRRPRTCATAESIRNGEAPAAGRG
ncbi:MAG TPA: class I SAM-dependent methyltransferase [Solirubrobacteraceae bacterium]|jgi:SAM-dependent methyltransferase|nr:class I SAM-dependent methyltransferase [Solirubrobacteraceae bacterium]